MAYNLQPSYNSSDDLTTKDRGLVVMYGRRSDGLLVPINIDNAGNLQIGTGLVLSASDIQLGAVEIKDEDSDKRLDVIQINDIITPGSDAYRGLLILGRGIGNVALPLALDAAGNLITSNPNVDVALSTRASEVTLSALNTKVTTSANGILVDGSTVTQPVLPTDQLYVTESFATSVIAYANARPVNGDLDVRRYKTKKIVAKNTGANAARINVLGSVDGGTNYDVVLVNNVALAVGNISVTDLTDALTHIRIEARAQNAGNATTVESRAYAMGS